MRVLVVTLASIALYGAPSELANVKAVYFLPMSNGMDQYLANRIQASDLYVVTTNPQAADAIFTDTLGPGFERRMEDLFPSEREEGEKVEQKRAERLSSFRKGKGMVFLVDRRTRQVVWSTYELPKDASSNNLDRAARRIADRLRRSLEARPGSAARLLSPQSR
ncbi:MAG: hypothetical protein NZV14_18245 [Bryobacteraceae bacterium]|nr:hypothetical protein [Bryobacteraceae bacterium]MDW8380107.1 hypothetical protein [Bryobacterales bacterium]